MCIIIHSDSFVVENHMIIVLVIFMVVVVISVVTSYDRVCSNTL